ncbi:MAG: DMT family transporter, partial [Acidimicrobiales bacterium]|nr:DMT family transporter [Acidimicrobiales bacterium]
FKPFTLTTYATTIAAVPILALTVPTLGSQDWSGVDATGWAAMTWVVIGPVFVAWSVWNWVLRHLDAERVAPLLFTVPVTSGIAASVLLDEQIAGGQIAGTALVVAGLLLNRHASRLHDRLEGLS